MENASMNFSACLFAHRSSRAAQRPQLTLLSLEDRTVPASVTVVSVGSTPDNVTTFLALNDAVTAAGKGGTVTIEPGSAAPTSIGPITESDLTIQGDPNVPSSILPALNLTINIGFVTLKNLNLSSVIVDQNNDFATSTRSTVGSITIQGSTSAGFNTISQNYISGSVSLGVPGVTVSGGSVVQ